MADRGPITQLMVRWIRNPFQALVIGAIYHLARLLPIETAAALGGRLFRTLGPRFRAHRVAERNIRRAFPDKSAAEVAALLDAVWHDLGQGAGEFAHLDRFTVGQPDSRIEVVGGEHLEAMRDDGKPGIIVSGHLGNWEVASVVIGRELAPLGQIYRGADNPWLDRLFRRARDQGDSILVPKGREGAAMALRLMRDGGHLGFMMDQKLNEGEAIPFFGRDAMTAPAAAALALRFRAPIVPGRCIRLPRSRFRIEFLPPLALLDSGDRKADVRALLVRINQILEAWIREYPEQWFWLHRRWPD